MAKPELRRVGLNLPVDLVAKIDDYADSLSLNRTTAMTVLLSTSLQQNDAILKIGDLLKVYNENV